MRSVTGVPAFHSRYEVLTEGELAWAADDKGTLYRFDGLRFTRRRRRDRAFVCVPSWQTPSYGWVRACECPCAVWTADRPRSPHPSGVAA